MKSQDAKDFDSARARNEAAKAGLNEIELKIKTGDYLSRTAFREASATLLAEVAQALRSIPDLLERKAGITPDQVQIVSVEVDQVLNHLSSGLEMFTEQAPPA